jgi:diguanylate cyclase (GGDEF)-like protein/PAS domain S-box-containing protein
MALGVAAVTMLLAGSAFLVSSLDRRAQHRTRRRMRELADAALDGLVLCEGGVIVDANARFEALVGLERTRVCGRPFGEFVLPAHRSLIPAPGDEMREIELLAEDGQVIPVEVVGRELKEGHGRRRVLAIRDIRERREAELRIRHLAYHDALTGLPNRVLFRQRMEDALARAERDGGELAVLCLDLDHFKRVNDTLGHPVGDALLKAVAERLRSCGQGGYTVARLSGDEFALVQAPIAKPSEAETLAQQIIEALRAPFELHGQALEIGASIGIAVMPGDGRDPDELLKSADMALFRAKADGRATSRFFESGMDARMQARRALEIDLRKALAEGQFELFYQPLVDLKADQVSGFEALLRWNHPVRGMVPPMEFIPLAEEIGLILPIGDWVLRQACAEAAAWPDHIKVAVNLSPNQFRSRSLVQTVVGALASSGLPAGRLELEITETVLLQENDQNLAILHQLRGLGVRISMDDFGTGYSSLSYLRSFPFDKIKIDRSFVKDLPLSTDCVAIIRAVAGLGSSLGVTTLAEGVETVEQLERLRQEGCDEAQGFLFSPPRPARELGPFLRLGAAAALKAA